MFFKSKKVNENSIILSKNISYNIDNIIVSKTFKMSSKVQHFKVPQKTNNFIIFNKDFEQTKNDIYIPNILKGLTNYIVFDDNDYIYNRTASKMKEKGYQIITFNLNDNLNSNHFNPFDMDINNPRTAIYIKRLIDCLDVPSKNYFDPFYVSLERLFFEFATVYFILKKKCSYNSLEYALNNISKIREELDHDMLNMLYKTINIASSHIMSSTIMGILSRLNEYRSTFDFFENDININDIPNKKTIIYFNFLTNENVELANIFLEYLIFNLPENYIPFQFMFNNELILKKLEDVIFMYSLKSILLFNCCWFDCDIELNNYNLVIYDVSIDIIRYFAINCLQKLIKLVKTKKNNEILIYIRFPEEIQVKDKPNNFKFDEISYNNFSFEEITGKEINERMSDYFYAKRIDYKNDTYIYIFKRKENSKIEMLIINEQDKKVVLSNNKFNTTNELFDEYEEYKEKLQDLT